MEVSMHKCNLLIAGFSYEEASAIKTYAPAEVEVTGVAESFQEAAVLLNRLSLQAILVRVAAHNGEAYEFVDAASISPYRPVVIAITDDAEACARAKKLGARKCFTVDAAPQKLFESVGELLRSGETEIRIKNSDRAIDEKLANIFIASGIPPHIKGYQFLREAVKQSVKFPEMINHITKALYPAVAEKFNTSASKVERAIRHAIEVAWSRGKIDNLNNIYGIKVFAKGEKPTNSELIALVSDKMLIEGL